MENIYNLTATRAEDEQGSNIICIDACADDTFEPLLSAEEAAELLRIHPKTLQALARAGTVPCIRMGKYWRFRKSSLDGWVSENLKFGNPVTARELRGQL